jgi:hypothetical protein
MPANTGVAPICNAKAEEPSFFTQPPRIPHFGIPTVGGINAIPGILSALQQLQQAVNQIVTSGPPQNNIPQIPNKPGSGSGGNLGGTDKNQQQQQGEWEVTARQTQNVKVVNPDDDSQFVIVKETTSITVENSTTGQRIVLNLVQN